MPTRNPLLIIIPTYCEAGNIEPIYRELSKLSLAADFLFVDDNSPDGTGKIIDRLVTEAPNIFVIHRPGKLGVGSAHQDALAWAYHRGYARALTMDADFTHAPDKVTDFLAAPTEADVVVGSRFKNTGSLTDWVWYRKLLTHFAHQLTHLLLGLPYDASGAFRVYRLDRIRPDVFSLVRERGYSFFWESLYILWVNGYAIHEIPIALPKRTYGTSKMRMRDVVKGLTSLLGMVWRRWFNRRSVFVTPRP